MVGNLGIVLINRKTLVMKFEVKGEAVTLVDHPTLVNAQILLKAMRMVLKKGIGFWVECTRLEVQFV